jgi:hypothetical protein
MKYSIRSGIPMIMFPFMRHQFGNAVGGEYNQIGICRKVGGFSLKTMVNAVYHVDENSFYNVNILKKGERLKK